jgi:hypothetical protein
VSIQRLRGRLPLVVFILLFLVCLVLIGLACACLSDQASHAVDRAVSLIEHSPAVLELWSVALAGLFFGLTYGGTRRRFANARAPAVLEPLLL